MMLLTLLVAGRISAEPVDLERAVARALERSGHVAAAAAAGREAEAAGREARRRGWPALSARAAAVRGDHPVYAFGELLEQRRLEPADMALDRLNRPGYVTSLKGALELSVPLYTARELPTRAAEARLAALMAEAAREAAEQELRARMIELFVEALSARERAAALAARVESAARAAAGARRLKDRGVVLGSDYFAGEAIVAGLEARLAAARRVREGADGALAALAGGGVEAAGTLSAEPYADDGDASGALPELRAAELEVGRLREASRREAASLWPRVEAFGSLQADAHGWGAAPSSRLGGIRAAVPLGDPAYPARRARALAAEEGARARRSALADAAAADRSRALAAYRAAADGLPALARMRERAVEALALAHPLYREGRLSVLELLRAEDAAAGADEAWAAARAGLHAARARALRAAGRLDAAAVSEIGRRLEAR